MANVVDHEEFSPWKDEVMSLRRELTFIRQLLTRESWLTTRQTLAALNVSDTTLYRLRLAGGLVWRKEGKKISYEINSVRNYLTAQKIEPWAVDSRIITASRL